MEPEKVKQEPKELNEYTEIQKAKNGLFRNEIWWLIKNYPNKIYWNDIFFNNSFLMGDVLKNKHIFDKYNVQT